jgi:5-methylcytosine-specific restriction endonuclease McrA
MAKARASKGLIVTPNCRSNESATSRERWLAKAESDFVTTTPVNKTDYLAILQALWPEGHGIPGPALSENDVRALIDGLRATEGKKPYKDPFRRMRELQGDEGFTCIIKEGNRYQMQNLEVSQKREPRAKLKTADWDKLRAQYGYKCANCGAQEPDVRLSPDHKKPRIRHGSNELGNHQPLCKQCNIAKSNMCPGCELKCELCPWAFPEIHKQIAISDDNKELARRQAEKMQVSRSELVNKILRDYFNKTQP